MICSLIHKLFFRAFTKSIRRKKIVKSAFIRTTNHLIAVISLAWVTYKISFEANSELLFSARCFSTFVFFCIWIGYWYGETQDLKDRLM